jgi:uncharacterized protein (TIGR02996 family)
LTHDDAFLASIIESPDDDAPRHIYADWLEEHEQGERAEFIRVQCALARMDEGDPGRAGLESRERELLARYEAAWLGSLRHPCLHWRFVRGFVAGLAHAGLFRRTQSIRDAEGYNCWHYLRFYADGLATFVTSDGRPEQVARWFNRRWAPLASREPPSGRYTLRWTSRAAEVSFGITAGYGTGFGLMGFAGAIEVGPSLFPTAADIRLVLSVHNHVENESGTHVFQLVKVTGYDSSAE